MITIHLDVAGEHHEIDYRSIAECLDDHPLAWLLDDHGARVSLWCGSRKLPGRPVTSSAQLAQQLESHRSVIERVAA